MKKIVLSLLLLSTLLFAKSSVWKVQKDNETIYIGGTIHLLRQSDYPLPKEYDVAYTKSNSIYFEVNMHNISDEVIQQKFVSAMRLTNNKKLSQTLSETTYKKLEMYATLYGLNLQGFENFKAVMVLYTLTFAEFEKMGLLSKGVDDYFEKKTVRDEKKIGALETLDEQVNYLATLADGNEDNFVIQSLIDLEKTQYYYKQMIQAWRNGDTETLDELLVKDIQKDYPKLYETIIVQRNHNWMPKIKAMFNNDKTEFVLVGLGHLIGEDGVLELLKKDGFTVEQID